VIPHQFRYDLLAFVRNRQSRFFTLVIPILFLVIFVSVFGNDKVGPDNVKASTYYVPGISALAVIAGRTLTAIVVALGTMTVLLLIGRFAYGVKLPTSTLPGVIATAVVGAVSFCCLAYALTTFIKSEDAAQPMVQAIMLPLYFISGVFIPNVNLPRWLRDVAEFFPVQHLADGIHHAFDPATHGAGIVWSDLGVLALWGAVGLAVALVRFTWTPAMATG